MIARVALFLAMTLAVLAPSNATAHALEPGFLELQPIGGDDWRVTWRKPVVGGAPMAIDAVLPEACSPRQGPSPTFDGRAFLTGWIATCPSGLAGGEIRIEDLEQTRTDVLVRYTLDTTSPPEAHSLTAASQRLSFHRIQALLAFSPATSRSELITSSRALITCSSC